MCDALFEQFQSGAGVILYRMGEGYARKLVEALPRLGISPEEVLQGLKRLGFMAGWGKFQFLVNDDETVNCTVDNSAFVLRREGAGPTTCYFLAGILSAVGTVISGKRYIARETHCSASGEATCAFKLYPDPRESKAGGIDLRNLKLLQ